MPDRSAPVGSRSKSKICGPGVLNQFRLFEGLTDEQLARVKQCLHARSFRTGVTIMSAEQHGEALYFLVRGTVRISVDDEEGKEVILGLRGPGEVLGEISLLDRGGHSANVTAEEETYCLWMDRGDFLECLRTIPTLAHNLAVLLARRVRVATEHIQFHFTQDVYGRVCRQFYTLAREGGVALPEGGTLLPVRLRSSTLAGMVGASRTSVWQAVKALKESGIVSLDQQDRVVVRDLKALTTRPR